MRRASIAAVSVATALVWVAFAGRVQAQAEAERGTTREEPDATRLDVERLPPEAIRITRDLYAHGFFLEASVGGRGWIGGLGRIASPGPFAAIGFGYEILDWLFVRAIGELEMHETSAPPPPGTAVFELLHALAEVKLQAHPSAEFALWLAGQIGITAASTAILGVYGLQNASTIGLMWGADVGLDAHFHSRHYSMGLHGGVRGAPSYDGFGELALGVGGGLYLRYVF